MNHPQQQQQQRQGASPNALTRSSHSQILRAAQQSPFDSKIPDIGNTATANRLQLLALSASETSLAVSEMVATITKASRHFDTFCAKYADGRSHRGTSRAVRPTTALATATPATSPSRTENKVDEDQTPRATRPAAPTVRRPLAPTCPILLTPWDTHPLCFR
ncbi:unnamed protein product [Tilletia controversa]|nr:unnamed protein product [Tilletia controversa]